ncbi:hypothetical protein SO802_028828 [Lithocarpus litseifolius]|uniref:CULT domain-containing protein n=1 Tax=Lithocarpus litseifolius TaxID=425828 RepID=A0AAW2BUJ1_9ROSI
MKIGGEERACARPGLHAIWAARDLGCTRPGLRWPGLCRPGCSVAWLLSYWGHEIQVQLQQEEEEEELLIYGAKSGWVEARTSCDHLHLASLSSDLAHIPTPNTPCCSDLSIWCFSCDAYLDAQVIMQLRPVYETAYILKFGEAPPFRTV